MNVVLLLAILFYSLIAILRLDLAVLFIIALLPSYLIRFSLFGVPLTFLEIMILISFALWFYKETKGRLIIWFKNRKKREPYPFSLEIILILFFAFIASLVTNFKFPELSLSAFGIFKAYFFEPLLLYILILNVLPGEKNREKIIYALASGALIVILPAIFQQVTGLFIFNQFWANPENRRVVSWFGYPNAIGLFLAPILMVVCGFVFGKLVKLNIFNFQKFKENIFITKIKSPDFIKSTILTLIIIFSALVIYFAKSEGALIAIIIAVFCFLFLANRSTQIISLILGIAALSFIILTPTLRTFTLNKIYLQDLSGEIRQQQWKETFKTLKNSNFIFGNGLAAYQKAVAPFHQEGIFFNRDKLENFDSLLYGSAELRAKYWQPVEIYLYPHNIFLNFWSELGLFGALIFMWLIFKFLLISLGLFLTTKKINKNPENKYLALGLFGAMLTVLVHGLVDVPFFKNDLAALFFILLALLGSLMVDHRHFMRKKI